MTARETGEASNRSGVAPPFEGQTLFPKTVQKIPNHIGLIMDGNGRWANARGLPRTEGHKAGEKVLLDVVAGAVEAGVPYVSAYAFSTENWNRSPSEVKFLMGYSRDVIRHNTDLLHEWNVKVRWVGRRGRLWKSVLTEIERAEEKTKNNTGTTLVLAINYGGRAELADAAKRLALDVENGKRKASSINEKTLARYLYAPDIPDIDLLIRTSGEARISNYMLWQLAYAELMVVPEPWPQFSREGLWAAMEEFQNRDRRFGGATDKVG